MIAPCTAWRSHLASHLQKAGRNKLASYNASSSVAQIAEAFIAGATRLNLQRPAPVPDLPRDSFSGGFTSYWNVFNVTLGSKAELCETLRSSFSSAMPISRRRSAI